MIVDEEQHLPNSVYFKLDALVLLNAADDVKQVAGLGIAIRPEHAHEAFGRLVGEGTQFFEADGRVDVVPEYDLVCIKVSSE